jgi:hypothetical protein
MAAVVRWDKSPPVVSENISSRTSKICPPGYGLFSPHCRTGWDIHGRSLTDALRTRSGGGSSRSLRLLSGRWWNRAWATAHDPEQTLKIDGAIAPLKT